MMLFADRARLLDPRPMPLELGWERHDSGVLHLAIRTDMHGCTGEMLEWWFGSRPATREYRWWHPRDHVSSTWIEGTPGVIAGAIHQEDRRGVRAVAPHPPDGAGGSVRPRQRSVVADAERVPGDRVS